jgi:hypothetical protein
MYETITTPILHGTLFLPSRRFYSIRFIIKLSFILAHFTKGLQRRKEGTCKILTESGLMSLSAVLTDPSLP